MFEDIFNYAPFMRNHFSLYALHEAVGKCSDEDLREVQRDMLIVVQIVDVFAKAANSMMKDAPEKFKLENSDDFLPVLFNTGKLLVWMIVSLRQNGYSPIINAVRYQVLAKVQEELNEEQLKKLAEASPQLVVALELSFQRLETEFQNTNFA